MGKLRYKKLSKLASGTTRNTLQIGGNIITEGGDVDVRIAANSTNITNLNDTFSTDTERLAAVTALTTAYSSADTSLTTTLQNQITSNDTDIATNASGLASEISDRQAAVTAVSATAIALDAVVTTNFGNADDVVTAAQLVITNAITSALNSEISATNSDITSLTSQITSNDTDIATNATSITTNATAITSEATTARAAESTNSTAITNEATTARAAESTNATAISAEATTARSAESTNASAITSEASTARAAESSNATNIASEITNRTNADTAITAAQLTITNAITSALNSEISATNTDITALQATYTNSQVDTEISTAINNLIDSSPGTLNTLNELAAAIGDDANYASTVTTALNARYTKTAADSITDAIIATVSSNDTDIGTNVTNISSNDTDIATNVTNISSNDTDIATNVTNIATNVTNIATNVTNISSNDTDIATNVTNIATNVTNISSNDTDISTNSTNIALKQDKLDGTHLHLHSGGVMVGIGTNTPHADAHTTIHGNGNHGVLALQDNRSQAQGVGGSIQFQGIYNAGTSQTLFGSIKAKKENGTAGHYGAHLELGTRANGTGNVATGLTITSSQNVEIPGTLTISDHMIVENGKNIRLKNEDATNDKHVALKSNTGMTEHITFRFPPTEGTDGQILATAAGVNGETEWIDASSGSSGPTILSQNTDSSATNYCGTSGTHRVLTATETDIIMITYDYATNSFVDLPATSTISLGHRIRFSSDMKGGQANSGTGKVHPNSSDTGTMLQNM